MMQKHTEGGKGHGSGMMNPHGTMQGNPHQGGTAPMPPGNMKAQ
jgi:hypothetical protein